MQLLLCLSNTLCTLCAGVLLSREELERAAELTARAECWLILDNTYEHFVYEGLQHHCVPAPHIIHLFSFSKVNSFRMPQPPFSSYQQCIISVRSECSSPQCCQGMPKRFRVACLASHGGRSGP